MRILIVDDVGFMRSFLSRMVEKLQHTAVVADSGSTALEMLKNDSTIRVVLTDLIMRDVDGVQLYRDALALERLTDQGSAALPQFILMTAARPGRNAQPRDVERINLAKKIGFFDVLYKPFGEAELGDILRKINAGSSDDTVAEDTLTRQAADIMRQVIATNDPATVQKFLARVGTDLKKMDDLASQLRRTSVQKTLSFGET